MSQKITYRDIVDTISTAKSWCATMKQPMYVSKQEVTGFDPAQVQMIEAVIGMLNRKGLLVEVPVIDYTERQVK